MDGRRADEHEQHAGEQRLVADQRERLAYEDRDADQKCADAR